MQLNNSDNYLMHIGTMDQSGRYPRGSGENPYQHVPHLGGRINELKKKGMSEKEIMKALNINTTELKIHKSLQRNEERWSKVHQAKRLKEKGYSLQKIAEIMGFENDSSVRALLDEEAERRMNLSIDAANFLKEQVDKSPHGMLEIGKGSELFVGPGISQEKMKDAIYILEMQGYHKYGGGIPRINNKNKRTIMTVLAKPEVEHKEIFDYDKISFINDFAVREDKNGKERYETSFKYPASLDSKRLQVAYAEEGGLEKDGLVELRPGVKDISLGNSSYAQVRILVDGTHYIKGMAVYNPDLPKGVDVRFNTNKKIGTPKMDVLKEIDTKDPNNPFGSYIKPNGQSEYIDSKGNRQLSVINKRAEEGDWDKWSNKLSAQFLSKQNTGLIKRQIDLTVQDRVDEFNDIKVINNPTVKKKLLQTYADSCDSAASHFKLAALPRQRYQVLIPMSHLKDTEVYARNYKDGEKVALIRYPHGGTFEIPILTVNNKSAKSKEMIGDTPIDAIGINSNVAGILSGADFDGDTVMVIPTGGNVNITSTKPLEKLKGFDPKQAYGGKPEGTFTVMKNTDKEMGVISNLINDMTLKGANEDDLAKAVRHSMVVIDAKKHKLDYKQSELDNDISRLKREYQSYTDSSGNTKAGGASTLISRSKKTISVPRRSGDPWIDPETGKKQWERINPETGKLETKTNAQTYKTYEKQITVMKPAYQKKNDKGEWVRTSKKEFMKEGGANNKSYREIQVSGTAWEKSNSYEYNKASPEEKKNFRTKEHTQMQKVKWMDEVDDAYDLVSDAKTQPEILYADYANTMKALGNEARKELISTPNLKYNPSAAKEYKEQVDSLDSKIALINANKPREKQALTIANAKMKQVLLDNQDMTKDEIRKRGHIEMEIARGQTGAARYKVVFDDKEWEAVQKGAITDSKLKQLLEYADLDKVRELATPKETTAIPSYKKDKILTMLNSGYSVQQISESTRIPINRIYDEFEDEIRSNK